MNPLQIMELSPQELTEKFIGQSSDRGGRIRMYILMELLQKRKDERGY